MSHSSVDSMNDKGTNNSISAVNIILICAENSAHPMLNDNLVQLINAESPVYMISIDNSLYIISIIVSDSFHALRANNLFRTLRGTSINTVRINNLFRMMRNSIRGIRGGNLIHGIRNVSVNAIRIDNLFRIMRNSIHTICANNLIRRISINAIHIDNLFRNNRMRRLSFNALRIGNSSRMISDPIREVRDILPNTTRSNNFFHILCDFFHMIRNPSYTRRISNLPRTSDVNSNVPQLRSALNYSSISSVLAQYGIQTYPINPICIIEPELNDDALHIIREYSMINEIRIGDLLHITRTSDSTYTLYIGDLTYAVHNAEAYQTVYISDFVRVVFSGSILYIIQCTNSLQMMRNLLHAAHAFNSFRTISASNSVHANSAASLYMIRIGNVAYMITTSDSIHVECFGNLFHVTSTRSSASAIRTCNVGESANIMRDGCSTILVVSIDGRSHTIRTDGSVCALNSGHPIQVIRVNNSIYMMRTDNLIIVVFADEILPLVGTGNLPPWMIGNSVYVIYAGNFVYVSRDQNLSYVIRTYNLTQTMRDGNSIYVIRNNNLVHVLYTTRPANRRNR